MILATTNTTGEVIGAGCFQADAKLRVVAVQGSANDWAAYADYDTCSEAQIVSNGLKLEEATAALLFPDVQMGYRR